MSRIDDSSMNSQIFTYLILCIGAFTIPSISSMTSIISKLPSLQSFSHHICSYQPSMVQWLSSFILPCLLFVCPAMETPDKISTFFNIYRHKCPILTQYHILCVANRPTKCVSVHIYVCTNWAARLVVPVDLN